MFELCERHPVISLSLLFVLGVGVLLLFEDHSSNQLMEEAAIEDAALLTMALVEFRTIYTSEVVARLKGQGVRITHDYKETEHAIPLPATLSMELGKRIGKSKGGAKTHLYSRYPFPWRVEKSKRIFRDPFMSSAWDKLTKDPTKPVFRIETLANGRRILRYATADLMRPACVGCHNTHPQTPRTGWQIGDVRGVLQVDLPLEQSDMRRKKSLVRTAGLVALLGLLGLFSIGLIVWKMRRDASNLEAQLLEGSKDLLVAGAAAERQAERLGVVKGELAETRATLLNYLRGNDEPGSTPDE